MADAKQVSQLDPAAMMARFKSWWKQDSAHCSPWHKRARDDFAFVAGDQWRQEDRSALEAQARIPITFNRTLTLIEAVSGIEINGRHETVYMPRGTEPGVVKKNELLSAASKWMDDESDAPSAQSRAWQDSIKTGMGWTEAAMSYDDEPDGGYVERRIDPREMFWDAKAREANLGDARRLWHVRTSMDIDEARAMFPGVEDEELHAAWCGPMEADSPKAREEKRKRDAGNGESNDEDTVTLVRIQWIESEPYYKATIADKVTGANKNVDVSPDELKALNAALKRRKMEPVRAVKLRRKVFKQAFIGARVLSEAPFTAPCPHFSFNCITGKADEVKGTWYGITQLVRDPQMWANKWLTQSLHILNTTARGGILAEKEAFANQRDAEENYARPDAITWMNNGAIQKGMVMPKPGAGLPAGHIELMQFAITSIRDASGINLEILGLREATQPGVLEAQRKQAGMTILATLFDSARAFRKRVGKVRLYYIQEYLANGRMVRLGGPDGEQYVPLVKDKVAGRYDVIVGDAPTSPNQKEQTWALLQPLLLTYKEVIPPELSLKLLRYSPLPSGVVGEIEAFVQEANQKKAADPELQRQKQIAQRGAIAEVEETEAKAAKLRAETRSVPIDDAVKVADAERARTHPPKPPERSKLATVQ